MLVPVPPHDVTPTEVQQELPDRLLAALERRWLESLDARQICIAPHRGGDVQAETRFIQIHEVKHGPDIGQSLHLRNMQNVISSLRDGSHSLTYAVCSDRQHTKLLMGVRRFSDELYQTADYVDVLCRALRSNYPGIILGAEPVPFQDYQLDVLFPLEDSQYLAAITGIPSLKGERGFSDFFTQSIDRLVDALRGETYTLLVLAEPILDQHLAEMLSYLRRLSEEIHTLVRRSISASRSESQSRGTSASQGDSLSIGLGGLVATLFGISAGRSWVSSTSEQYSDSAGTAITQETLNKTAQFCEQTLEHFLLRLQSGRSLGFWNVGVYLASDDVNTFLRAQGIARSLYSGQHTYFEPLRILDLTETPPARDALKHLRNPSLDPSMGQLHPLGLEYQSIGTPLTTEELSILISLPHREVPGLKLSPVADFNVNPPRSKGFELGRLLYRGEELPIKVSASSKSLTRHTFITGLTGSGKTNTCLALLANAYKNQRLKFLVIDPAKIEYRFLLYAPDLDEDLLIFTLGDEQTAPFRLNPFEFVRGFPLLTHIDLIKAVFNAAFPMYASMPYLLEEALLAIYQERGWDVATSSNRFIDIRDPAVDYTLYLPRLSDLYSTIDTIVASKRYGAQLTQDISAALKARLGSLLHGGKGLMLDTQRSIPLDELVNRPVILELRRAGDDDEKAFVMALFFILLYEVCQTRPLDNQLQHVTLIEEAHRLLRNIPQAASAEASNSRGKAVEMFSDMMAEMRAYGEGFIIVDQMPGKLVPDVIKGSNLKIVHRLMAQDDRLAVGNAMGLTPSQLEHLPRLTVGQAVVHSEELGKPCLVKINPAEDELAAQQPGNSPQEREKATRERLKKQMGNFYSNHRDLFRRHPACDLCDAPCTYQPGQNRSTDQVLELAAQFLTVLSVGQTSAITHLGHRLRTALDATLQRRYPGGYSPGHARCTRIILATQAAQRFYQAYPHAESWKSFLQLQTNLARTWENWPLVTSDLNDLRQLIIKHIATAPARPRPGCTQCPSVCWFGHRFQTENNPAVQRLAAQLKAAAHTQRPNVEKLITFATREFRADIQPQLRPVAAYCLLTQASDDESLLADFGRRAFKKTQ